MSSTLVRPAPARASSPAVILAIILACQLMIVLDVSVVITALPRPSRCWS
jgi:hypothetical protein